MRRRALPLVILFTLVAAASAPAQTGPGVLVVTLADGTSVPLNGWSFSYEYQAVKAGAQGGFPQAERRNTADLWVGKKVYPMASATLDIQYRVYEQQVEVDGQMQKRAGAVVTGLTVTAAGKRNEGKLEPPDKELLMPEGSKGLLVQPRSLDVHGETLTGTKRDFCVLSYSPLVECNAEASGRVVKLELQH